MKSRPLLFGLGSVVALLSARSVLCQCTPATTDKTTWGGNTIVVLKDDKRIRSVYGVVKDQADKPLNGVLVEVYDHPDIVVHNPSPNRRGQTRIAVCKTDESGYFSLDVPAGRYEVRFSKSSEWNVTSVPVRVSKSSSSRKTGLVVKLTIGQ